MDPITLLEEAVRIPSTSGNERKVADYLVQQMQELGFDAHIDEAGNAIGMKGEGKTILMVGHIDTVGGEVPVQKKRHTLYGRGTVDAKGPLCTFIMAAAQAALKNRVIIVGAVEEEAPTSKGARFILDKYEPDYIIIGEPSGYDAVTIGYKGRLMVDFHKEQDMSHTASKGYGVIEDAIAFYSSLRDSALVYNGDKFGPFKELQLKIQHIQSGSDGLKEWVDMTLGYRVPVGYDMEKLKKYINTLAEKAEVKIYGEEQPIRAQKNNTLVRAFLKSIRAHKLKPTFKVKTGTSDMNILGEQFDVPILAYGPGDSALDHTPNEHINLDEYKKAIDILADVLENL